MANTLNYMDIKTVIVSCGTCMDQLLGYEFEKIFPGCRLLDIHEYLMEKGDVGDGPHPNPLPGGAGTRGGEGKNSPPRPRGAPDGAIPLPRSLPHADEDT